MQTQLAPKLHLGWLKRAAAPVPASTDGGAVPSLPADEQQLRRALPILAAWFAFYAIAVVTCLYADRQQLTNHAATTPTETVGSR